MTPAERVKAALDELLGSEFFGQTTDLEAYAAHLRAWDLIEPVWLEGADLDEWTADLPESKARYQVSIRI